MLLLEFAYNLTTLHFFLTSACLQAERDHCVLIIRLSGKTEFIQYNFGVEMAQSLRLS
ncbi:hypothetical protein JYT31_02610 [Beggiatoa alba]|nr:hypothetical protein [Beggiatoa alba]